MPLKWLSLMIIHEYRKNLNLYMLNSLLPYLYALHVFPNRYIKKYHQVLLVYRTWPVTKCVHDDEYDTGDT